MIGIYEVDMLTGKFLNVSQVVYEGLGYTKEEIEGSPVSNFLSENSIKLWEKRREQILEGKFLDSRVEFVCIAKDRTLIPVVIDAYYRVENGKINGAIVAVREIKNA